MPTQVKGTFVTKRTMQPAIDLQGQTVAHMTFNKEFSGDLAGTSTVAMMGVMFEGSGSGGYVALERVVAVLHGRSGGFLLQHSSLLTRGKPTQQIQVIPDSGFGDLVGLSGSMQIDVEAGQHFYTFDYQLA